MENIGKACGSFGITVSEAKTDPMLMMTKRMYGVIFAAEAAGQVHKQTTTCACAHMSNVVRERRPYC